MAKTKRTTTTSDDVDPTMLVSGCERCPTVAYGTRLCDLAAHYKTRHAMTPDDIARSIAAQIEHRAAWFAACRKHHDAFAAKQGGRAQCIALGKKDGREPLPPFAGIGEWERSWFDALLPTATATTTRRKKGGAR